MDNLYKMLAVLISFVILHQRVSSTFHSHHGHQTQPSTVPQFHCPQPCFCNQPSRIVYCSRKSLATMPVGISESSLQLNLNGNIFQSTRLQKKNFTGLPMLEHLYLSDCAIEEIEEGAFSQMQRLRWLDLSNNRIKFLTSAVFKDLTLLHLFLNGNRNLHLQLDSFDGLLTGGLYLNECHLSKLNPEVLTFLNSSLKYLWLDDNHFVDLDPLFENVFSKLSHLRLGSNPLRCDCETVWLKNLFDTKQEIFKGAKPPSCGSPKRLDLIQFNELTSNDFQCISPSFGDVEAELSLDHARLKCTAGGDPLPTLFWIQPSGQTTKYEPDASQYATLANKNGEENRKRTRVFTTSDRKTTQHNKTARTEAGEHQIRNEAVLYVDKKNVSSPSSSSDVISGMFICVAKNAAGNSTLAVKITWPPSHHQSTSVHFSDVITDKIVHVRPSNSEVQHPPTNKGYTDSSDDDANDGNDDDDEEDDSDGDGYDDSIQNQFRHHRKNQLIVTHSRRDRKPQTHSKVQADNHQEEQSRKINTANFYLSNYTVLRVPISDDAKAVDTSSEVETVAIHKIRLFSLAELICAIVGTHLCTLVVCLILAPLAMSIAKRWQRKLQATRLKSEIGGAAGLVDDVAGVWVKERVGDNPALNCGGFDRATACVQLSSSSRSSSDRSDIYSRCYPVETYNGITRYA